MNAIREKINLIVEAYNNNPASFDYGFATAAAVIVIFSIIILVLRFVYRYPRRSRGIEIKGPRGSIFISSGAISDLVKSIGGEYDLIEISKVNLMEDSDISFLEIQVSLDNDKESSFISISDELQNNILNTLKERFGIDTVKEVKLTLRKIESRKSDF